MIPARNLLCIGVAALCLCACKPTQRTGAHHNENKRATQAPAAQAQAQEKPAENPTIHSDKAGGLHQSLLRVNSVSQKFTLLRPWEKEGGKQTSQMGVYLGKGMVLCSSAGMTNCNFAELGNADGTRSIPARVQYCDPRLGLALLCPVHEEDKDLFEAMPAAEIGDALQIGQQAELQGLTQGITPISIPVRVYGAVPGSIPRLSFKAAQALPENSAQGLPILCGNKLCALGIDYRQETQSIIAINAEIIQRFLHAAEAGTAVGINLPSLGIQSSAINDPVFCRYLQLPSKQGGVYISKVLRGSAAEEVGLQAGDVILSLEGMPLDKLGRVLHPLYGPLPFGCIIRSHKEAGQYINLRVSRKGQEQEYNCPLNDAADSHALVPHEDTQQAPRYIVWGGLVFQPLTQDYLQALRKSYNDTLPLSLLKLDSQEERYRAEGRNGLVLMSLVIPTSASLSYESLQLSIVDKVNGKTVHSFAELAALLDEETEDGITSISINQAPYRIYIDRGLAAQANTQLLSQGIPQLRLLDNAPAATEPPAAKEQASATAPAPATQATPAAPAT